MHDAWAAVMNNRHLAVFALRLLGGVLYVLALFEFWLLTRSLLFPAPTPRGTPGPYPASVLCCVFGATAATLAVYRLFRTNTARGAVSWLATGTVVGVIALLLAVLLIAPRP
jgi:hypothetical protein